MSEDPAPYEVEHDEDRMVISIKMRQYNQMIAKLTELESVPVVGVAEGRRREALQVAVRFAADAHHAKEIAIILDKWLETGEG